MTPLVSVLIPVYNVEAFIGKCLRSVLRQDYSNMEIILVNDCSTDRSIALAEEVIAKENSQQYKVQIVHHERNRGLAAARATSLSLATGEYLLFLDSDDYWDNDSVVSQWIATALQTDSPIVISDYVVDYPKQKIRQSVLEIKTGREYIQAILSGRQPAFLWNKLIRRKEWEEWNGGFVEGLALLEDYRSVIPFLYHVERIGHLHIPTVHYVQQNLNSLIHQINMKQKRDLEAVLEYLSHYLLVEQKEEDFAPYIGRAYINIKMMLFNRIQVRDYPIVRSIHPEYDRYLSGISQSTLNKCIYKLQSTRPWGYLGWLLLKVREGVKKVIR